jgi:hypothetical protein
MYSCGYPPRSALALNPIEGFETTSRIYSGLSKDRLVKSVASGIRNSGRGACGTLYWADQYSATTSDEKHPKERRLSKSFNLYIQ